MEEEIKIGDVVQLTGNDPKRGYVTSIVDYGTHVIYFIDFGEILKFPAKREWIKKVK